MIQVSFFHKETGLFNGSVLTVSDPKNVELNSPADHAAIGGAYDHLSQRVDITTGTVVDYQPPAPSPDHEWHAPTKRWQLSGAAQAKAAAIAAAQARISALEALSGPLVRKAVLGDEMARERLRAIDSEICSLSS